MYWATPRSNTVARWILNLKPFFVYRCCICVCFVCVFFLFSFVCVACCVACWFLSTGTRMIRKRTGAWASWLSIRGWWRIMHAHQAQHRRRFRHWTTPNLSLKRLPRRWLTAAVIYAAIIVVAAIIICCYHSCSCCYIYAAIIYMLLF